MFHSCNHKATVIVYTSITQFKAGVVLVKRSDLYLFRLESMQGEVSLLSGGGGSEVQANTVCACLHYSSLNAADMT